MIRYARGTSKFDAHPVIREAADFDTFERDVLADRARVKGEQYICAPLKTNGEGRPHRCKEGVEPRRFLALDVDDIQGAETYADLRLWLARFRGFGFTTASSTQDAPRCRIIIELDRAVDRPEGVRIGAALVRDIAAAFGDAVRLDSSTHRGEQPCYAPVAQSVPFRLDGDPLDVDAWLADAPEVAPERKGSAAIAPDDDPVIAALKERGMYRRALGAGRHAIRCPWEPEHTEPDPEASTATAYMQPHHQGFKTAGFACKHKHCLHRKGDDLLTFLGVDWRALRDAYGERSERTQDDSEIPAHIDDGPQPEGTKEAPKKRRKDRAAFHRGDQSIALDDFYAYLPDHRYIYRPTRELWQSEGVNGCLSPVMVAGNAVKPARWLDQNKGVEQITWAPGEPELIEGKIIREGGFIERAGARGYNLYRPPTVIPGKARAARPWLDHLHRLYPGEADELARWFAQRVQHPGCKINHAVVLAGNQGVGKDTILEPVKHAVGPWNWSEIGPSMLMGRFNGWARSVIVRVSEVRDLGDVDRFAFYEHIKIYAAAPPDVLRLDEKNLREYTVPNVLGLILTTNYGITGMYLPPDDRRHFVASSSIDRSAFDADYFPRIYRWFDAGGHEHVAAYLREMDLSTFNPKAPPRQTAAHRAIVMANTAPEEGELSDLLETLGNPDVVSVQMLRESADNRRLHDLVALLDDPKRRRVIPHRLGEAAYDPVPNPDRKDGLWWIAGRRGAIYARRSLPLRARIEAARGFCA